MKKITYITATFLVLLWGGAALLREDTLRATNGRCEAMFMCICNKIGTGICDGIHDHNGYYR